VILSVRPFRREVRCEAVAYHVKQGCVGEGSSPVYAPVGVGLEIGRGGGGDADDGLHDGVQMTAYRKLGQEVKDAEEAARPSIRQ
jgi:hypothetical protein